MTGHVVGSPECFWRKLVLVVYESIGGNRPEGLEDDEELLTSGCNDINEWRLVLGTLEEQVFWDADYENNEMFAMSPEDGTEMRGMFGVAETITPTFRMIRSWRWPRNCSRRSSCFVSGLLPENNRGHSPRLVGDVCSDR